MENKNTTYYRMEGRFAQRGKFDPNNTFKGFIELENEIYERTDKRRTTDTQFFKGIQYDDGDKMLRPRLILGAIESHADFSNGKLMSFHKFVNNPIMTPLTYGLGLNKDKKTWSGSWMPELTPEPPFERAEITMFHQLTDEQVKHMRVEEFLSTGYAATSPDKLPPQMLLIASRYYDTKNGIENAAKKFQEQQRRAFQKMQKENGLKGKGKNNSTNPLDLPF